MNRMQKSTITGGLVGLVIAAVLALPSVLPPAVAEDEPVRTMLKTADEIFPDALDGDEFVKPPRFIVEPYVSTEIVKERTVKKIGLGKTSFVRIVTTASGTYSSDGIDSPYIRYPGIYSNPEWEEWQRFPVVLILGDSGWAVVSHDGADSIQKAPLFHYPATAE